MNTADHQGRNGNQRGEQIVINIQCDHVLQMQLAQNDGSYTTQQANSQTPTEKALPCPGKFRRFIADQFPVGCVKQISTDKADPNLYRVENGIDIGVQIILVRGVL